MCSFAKRLDYLVSYTILGRRESGKRHGRALNFADTAMTGMRQMIDSDDGSMPRPSLSPKAVLKHNYLFRSLSDSTLEGIAALAAKRTFYKGSVIFSQGDEGDALFGVASGRVRISASASGGREVFLNIM